MSRTEYAALRRAARYALRARWMRLDSRLWSWQERDNAERQYHAAVYAIPGGLTRPLSHLDAQLGLGIPSWQARRTRVREAVRAKRMRARITATIDRMAHAYGMAA